MYDVILADPPWSYTGAQDKWGAAAKFYKTMTDQELLSFERVQELLSPRGVLFMWATCPRLDFALKVLEAWGLTYRGVAFVWVKTRADGTPIRAQGVRPSVVKPLTELVLVASRVRVGRPMPLGPGAESVVQTVFAPREEHSKKPLEVHKRIEALYPQGTKLELFARDRQPGWDAWGDEVDG